LLMIVIEQHFDTSHADHDNSYYHRKLRCRSWISEHKRLATLSCASGSEVIEQRHKTKVHVNLLMAVKQRPARIVCGEIDFDFLITAEHHHIFDDAGGIFAGDSCQFETVTMQMHRMNVVALVAHSQAIAFA